MGSKMGKIKEERRKNRRKRYLMQVSKAALVVVLPLLILCFWPGDELGTPLDTSVGNSQYVKETETFDESEMSSGKESSETEEVTEVPIKEELCIRMVGDMLMHTRVVESGLQSDGSYNFDHLFMNMGNYIQEADIAIVNQETIMGGAELGYSGYPRFNSPYELADAEVKAGFNVVLHATNHTTDKGKQAVLNCMEYWDTNYPQVNYLGINRTKEEQDSKIYVFEKNGIKVAILNYTYTVNGGRMPSDMPYLVNLMTKGQSEKKIIADIQKAEQLADFTIVCPHWGTEYQLTASKTQRYWTQIFLENGVDLVIGTHPHVIEPIEWVEDENGNKMLVYYSLGNYVNGTSSTGSGVTNRMVGGIADVTIGRDENGKVVILENGVEPIVCHIGEKDVYTVYFLKDYTEELAKENRIRKQDSEFSKALCDRLVSQVWGLE